MAKIRINIIFVFPSSHKKKLIRLNHMTPKKFQRIVDVKTIRECHMHCVNCLLEKSDQKIFITKMIILSPSVDDAGNIL